MSLPWKHALIVGASSGMGAELARQLAAGGCSVALVSRREAEMTRLAEEIEAAAASSLPPADIKPRMEAPAACPTRRSRALVFPHDVKAASQIPALFQQICRELGGLDLIIYASGIMPRIAEDEYSLDKDSEIVTVNVVGAMGWINDAALRFSRAGAGTIVGISSVAGDRGRRGNPAYCASKAALNTYLESIRNRVGRLGVAVVTVKMGPVATPMTEGLDKLPLLISAPAAARAILNAAGRRRNVVYIPWKWRPIMFILRCIPSFLFRRMRI